MEGSKQDLPETKRQPVVRPVEGVPRHSVEAGNETEVQVLLGSDDGAPNFTLRRFIMGKGGGMPLHRNRVEHEQYVLRGRARVGLGAEIHEVAADQVLFIPAGLPHFYEVLEAPFEFLCIVPQSIDQIEMLDASPETGAGAGEDPA